MQGLSRRATRCIRFGASRAVPPAWRMPRCAGRPGSACPGHPRGPVRDIRASGLSPVDSLPIAIDFDHPHQSVRPDLDDRQAPHRTSCAQDSAFRRVPARTPSSLARPPLSHRTGSSSSPARCVAASGLANGSEPHRKVPRYARTTPGSRLTPSPPACGRSTPALGRRRWHALRPSAPAREAYFALSRA